VATQLIDLLTGGFWVFIEEIVDVSDGACKAFGGFLRLLRFGASMAARGRFGKYGDHKRKSGLRKNRILKNRLQKSRRTKDTACRDKMARCPERDERLS
jgi:hypothetical protein